MKERSGADHTRWIMRRRRIATLGASLAAILACVSPVRSASLELSANGDLAIDGRRVSCKPNVQTILDARLPNLGIATRSLLVLNPHLLRSLSPTVRMFVYHHECGHHHVGGDELGADCWAVTAGVSAGWLHERQLGEICTSFGNAKATATHPATERRCRALRACFVAAVRTTAQTAARAAPQRPAPSAPLPKLVHEGFSAPISPER